MWHQNLEGGELAGSSVGPIVGGVIAVRFLHRHHCHHHHHHRRNEDDDDGDDVDDK